MEIVDQVFGSKKTGDVRKTTYKSLKVIVMKKNGE